MHGDYGVEFYYGFGEVDEGEDLGKGSGFFLGVVVEVLEKFRDLFHFWGFRSYGRGIESLILKNREVLFWELWYFWGRLKESSNINSKIRMILLWKNR